MQHGGQTDMLDKGWNAFDTLLQYGSMWSCADYVKSPPFMCQKARIEIKEGNTCHLQQKIIEDILK